MIAVWRTPAPGLRVVGATLALLLAVGATGAEKRPRTRQEVELAALRDDPRLRAEVTVPNQRYQVLTLAKLAAKASSMPPFVIGTVPGDQPERFDEHLIVVQPLTQRRLGGAVQQRPISELLEALACATGAQWCRVRKSWVLTDVPALAELATLNLTPLSQELSRRVLSFRDLTPAQLRRLSATGGLLTPADLTQVQRQALLDQACFTYTQQPDTAREALKLAGTYLILQGDNAGYRLGLHFPQQDGKADSAQVDVPLPNLPQDASLPVWQGQPLPPLRPDLTTTAAPPAGEDPELENDPRLDTVVRRVHPSTRVMLEAAATAAGFDYLVGSVYLDRPLPLPSTKPGEPPPRHTARDVLTAAARITGGTWRRVGKIYVLKPEPALERLRRLQPLCLQAFVEGEMNRFGQSLSRKACDRLRAGETLFPAQLNSDQKRHLEYVAAGAFARGPYYLEAGVARLQEVELRCPPAPPDKPNWRRSVFLYAHTLDGRSVAVASASLR